MAFLLALLASAIVTPAKLRPLKGPVIRLGDASNLQIAETARSGSAIVEPKRKRTTIFGTVAEDDPEANLRAGERAMRCSASWCAGLPPCGQPKK